MNVLCCQLDIVWEDKPANHAKVEALLEQAVPLENSLVVLPEMFATGFSMNVSHISDSDSHHTHEFLARTARRFSVYILGGIVTTGSDGRGRNECVVFSPDGAEIDRYAKLHPFTFGSEARHYTAGCDVHIFACREFTVAPFICYDLRFPEAFRTAVQQGANLFTVIANWPVRRAEHWTALLKARAIENQAYVIGVNRCGTDPQFTYSGGSVIFDPHGHAIAEAGTDETTITVELDLQALLDYRERFPALKDIHNNYLEK